jgi:hypothetical protein
VDRPEGCLGDECVLTRSQARQIQEVLCLEMVDASFGPDTRAAIVAFEASRSEMVSKANGRLEARESSALLHVGPCGAPFSNALERFRYGDKGSGYRRPSPTLVQALAASLEDAGAAFPGPKPQTFDGELREAIGQVQRKMGQKETRQVTKELLDNLPVL